MRRTTIVAASAALTLAVSACGSSSKPAAGDRKSVAIQLIKAGCEPAHLELPAGPTTFEVTNKDADAVSEFEVIDKGGRILGERENLTPGLSGSFSITLKPGTYGTACPGGSSTPSGELVVADGDTTPTTAPAQSAAATKAVATYRTYVEAEAQKLVADTTAFADAINAGDLARAKQLFPRTRTHYESIEPIAESFGDLDPEIDARANDVPAAKFEGFHRIEQQMWQKGNLDGVKPVATSLLGDVKQLRSRIRAIDLEPAQLANGAVELLNEVASSKITGEEDRYSHTDLWDFEANLEGAKQAYLALRPLVAVHDPELARKLDTRFAATEAVLAKCKQGDGFKLYTDLTKADTRAMAAQVDALADALSKVAPIVVKR